MTTSSPVVLEPLVGTNPSFEDLTVLRRDLETRGWSPDTAAGGYEATNPSSGQCAVTALVVQDRFGGRLLRAPIDGGSHYFNRVADGRIVDLTRDQFASWEPTGPAEERPREYLLSNASTASRYALLTARLG